LTDTVRDLLSRFTLLEIIEEIQRQSPHLPHPAGITGT
jgi:hypothetical protein